MKKWIFALFALGIIAVTACKKGDPEVPGSNVTGVYMKTDLDSTGTVVKFSSPVCAGTLSRSLKKLLITSQNTNANLSLEMNVNTDSIPFIPITSYPLGVNTNIVLWNGTKTSLNNASGSQNITIKSVTKTEGGWYVDGTFSATCKNATGTEPITFTNGEFRSLVTHVQ